LEKKTNDKLKKSVFFVLNVLNKEAQKLDQKGPKTNGPKFVHFEKRDDFV